MSVRVLTVIHFSPTFVDTIPRERSKLTTASVVRVAFFPKFSVNTCEVDGVEEW